MIGQKSLFICFLRGAVPEPSTTVEGCSWVAVVEVLGQDRGEAELRPCARGRSGTWPSTLSYMQGAESLGRVLAFLFCQQCPNL